MDKNSIIGWVLIALLMIGFFGYQSRQIKKQQAWQAQLDSLAAVEAYRQDSIRAAYLAEHPEDTVVAALPTQAAVYSDSLLNAAANAEAQTVTLQNDKLEIVFTTLGAQEIGEDLAKSLLTYYDFYKLRQDLHEELPADSLYEFMHKDRELIEKEKALRSRKFEPMNYYMP